MDLNPGDIARKNFTLVRRGFDPQEVTAYLETLGADVSSQRASVETFAHEIAALEVKLKEARSTEEAVHMTMIAATKTKEEMVSQAEARAAEILADAEASADSIRKAANDDAERTITGARSEALELLNSSHQDAKELVSAARAENNELVGRIEELRRTSERVAGLLKKIAADGTETVTAATAALDSLGTTEMLPELESPTLDEHSAPPPGRIDLVDVEPVQATSPATQTFNPERNALTVDVAPAADTQRARSIPAVFPAADGARGMLGQAEAIARERSKPTMYDPVDEAVAPADRDQILTELRNLGSH